MQKPMFHKTWNEKQAEYMAEHNAYLTGFKEKEKAYKAKQAAFNAAQKADFTAHHQTHNQAMGDLNKETLIRSHTQAHAVSADANSVSAFNKSLGKYMF